MGKKFLPTLLFLSCFLIGFCLLGLGLKKIFGNKLPSPEEIAKTYPTSSPTPTPTPKPLTFAEMNALYGPCVYLPTLMYHHVQNMDEAQKKNQQNLTVSPEYFRKHMQYLKEKGYNVVSFAELISFFDNGIVIPKKSILITFDDGYDDFYLNALPILKEFGYKAAVFVPTGLIDNPGYLLWVQVTDAAGGGISFGNHTWSHKNMMQKKEIIEKEIAAADVQLSEKGLNSTKVFAYPYGFGNSYSEEFLNRLVYKLAFTTKYGRTLCKKQRLELPRIRIGNNELSPYGL
jgi:peptidoglycan/xylan/chitin deacetylase (PgdA/CDA1 family)